MHTCETCGKKMATPGGLEIHEQLAHSVAPARSTAPAMSAATAATPTAPAPANAPESFDDRFADVVPLSRPRSQTRPAIPAIALAVVILLVTGVAAALVRNGGNSSLALVQSADAATQDGRTARVSATVKTDSGPLADGITADGGFDFGTRRARLEVDPAQYGIPGTGKISAIADYSYGLVMYMRFPPQIAAELPGGKPWVKFDLSALLRQSGVDVDTSSLLQGQSNDPTSGLAMLHGADNVVELGTEQVRGVDTTHYRAEISFDKAISEASSPQAKEAMQKLSNLYTVRNIPVEVWLDNDGRLRRFQESLDTGTMRLPQELLTQGNPLEGHVTVTYDLYDFGAAVDTELPPADQVNNLNKLLNSGR